MRKIVAIVRKWYEDTGLYKTGETVHEIETQQRVYVRLAGGVWLTTGNYKATVFLISDTNEIPSGRRYGHPCPRHK